MYATYFVLSKEFNRCLDSGRYREEIEAARVEAAELGVGTTPTTIINRQLVEGAVPFERLQAFIESELVQSSEG